MKHNIKTCLCTVLCLCIFFTNPTYADILSMYEDPYVNDIPPVGTWIWDPDYGNSELCNNVIRATELLEELLELEYQSALMEIWEKTEQNNWDYDLTMESVNQNGNPFTQADLSKLVAVCCTAVKYGCTVTDIDYLDTYCTEYSMPQTVPYKTDIYKKRGDGLYEPDGTEYVYEAGYVDTFEKSGTGYKKTGRKWVEPTEKTVTYAKADIRINDAKTIFTRLRLNMESAMESYRAILYAINADQGIDIENLCKNILIRSKSSFDALGTKEQEIIYNAIENTDGNRKILLSVAATLIGKIPYEWGGKAKEPGYDNSWWSFGENGKQKGLDCSGYVQWCFMTAGYKNSIYDGLISTKSILKDEDCSKISREELLPGDLGLLHENSGKINHVGIYVGDGYFIHCSSGTGTVTVSKPNFTVFIRVNGVDNADIAPYDVTFGEGITYTEEDVVLLAKLIAHEVRGQGLNSWIAVGEVVINRVKSPLFPDNLYDVIYQESEGCKQFSYNEGIEKMDPGEDIVRTARGVLDGTLHVLSNPNVLFFRNPGDPDNNEDWGPFKFYTRIGPVCYYLGKDW